MSNLQVIHGSIQVEEALKATDNPCSIQHLYCWVAATWASLVEAADETIMSLLSKVVSSPTIKTIRFLALLYNKETAPSKINTLKKQQKN